MSAARSIAVSLLPGSRELLRAHARALPQRDDFCGAFCGALALAAADAAAARAGPAQRAGEIDQDAVASLAGTTVSANAHPETLPHGETGRRDYRLAPTFVQQPDESGTNAPGLVRAIAALSRGGVHALPYDGPWTVQTLTALFDAAAELERPATLIANLATRWLWGARAGAAQLVSCLLEGSEEGPEPDWDVGHFVCVFARIDGPAGALYALADTYPALGARGVHVQPRERLALALQRPGMAPGGVIAVVHAADAAHVRERASAAGLHEGVWDNGSVEILPAAHAGGGVPSP